MTSCHVLVADVASLVCLIAVRHALLHHAIAGSASLFDVGHMGQIKWHGKDAAAFLERVTVADVAELKPGEAQSLRSAASVGHCL